jgi:Cu2+-exporting ATPase
MLALPIEGYTFLIFLTNYNYNYETFCFCRHGVCENPFQEVEDIKNQSVVYVGVDNTLAGLIYFEDQIREDARHVVESLSCQGINVYMLSGDRKKNAEYVASLVGIPKDKVRKL